MTPAETTALGWFVVAARYLLVIVMLGLGAVVLTICYKLTALILNMPDDPTIYIKHGEKTDADD